MSFTRNVNQQPWNSAPHLTDTHLVDWRNKLELESVTFRAEKKNFPLQQTLKACCKPRWSNFCLPVPSACDSDPVEKYEV